MGICVHMYAYGNQRRLLDVVLETWSLAELEARVDGQQVL